MSSARYPGKVLAILNGKPIIMHVFERVKKVLNLDNIVVLTSTEPSDDILVSYLQEYGINVFRGSLDDVFTRFKHCLKGNDCDYFFRVCGDSPLLESYLFQKALSIAGKDSLLDIVTNKFPQTFPPGKSVELIKTDTFLSVDVKYLSKEEKEHVTMYFYNHPNKYKIYNIECRNIYYKHSNYAVDNINDLSYLEKCMHEEEHLED